MLKEMPVKFILLLLAVATTGFILHFAGKPASDVAPTPNIGEALQTAVVAVPSVMEISAAEYKDTVKYSPNGYTLRTITIESYIQVDDGSLYIKEADGPHFTLENGSNINESSVGHTFDCMLKKDDSGFTSGIVVGKCSER